METRKFYISAALILALGLLVFVTATLSTSAAPSAPQAVLDVVVSEVAWMGTTVAWQDEWIELYNNTGNDVSLDGWRLVTDDNDPDIALTGVIPAGGYFLLERTDDNSAVPLADDTYTGNLGNTGEVITLIDEISNVVDVVGLSGQPWFAGDNGTKETMVRTALTASGTLPTSWATGVISGTPTNSILDVDSDTYGFSPNIDWTAGTGPGYEARDEDCDDKDPNTYPGAPEVLDNKDNDCDGNIDNGFGLGPFDYTAYFNSDTTILAWGKSFDPVPMETALIGFINAATSTIDVAIYGFDRLSLQDALIAAHDRGVTVRVIGDDEAATSSSYYLAYNAIISAGIPVVLDPYVSYLHHNKFAIFDGRVVWTGSTNWTDNGFTYNANNSIVITSSHLALAYTTEFNEMFDDGHFAHQKQDNTTHVFSYTHTLVESYFSPSDGVEDRVAEVITNATESLYFAMFYWTSDYLGSLVYTQVVTGGLTVSGVWDTMGAASDYSEDERLCSAGVPLKVKNFRGKVHDKFAVVDVFGDDPIVILGSYNWTASGAFDNDENTLIIHDADLALAYYQEYLNLYKSISDAAICHSVPPDQDLSDTPDWISHEADDVRAMAVGDFDLDGDLDLATAASDAPVRVFINNGSGLPVTASWTAAYTETAYSIAWADVNGDGYLDLGVGNDGPNRLYVYSPTLGSLVAVWESAESEFTRSIAWADWDGDGDPDLAVGNDGQANRVYRNDDGALTPAWQSGETDATHAVAWGDWDDDDDMDLAVGNFGDLRVYRNTGGAFTPGYLEDDLDVHSLAWADFNEDGNFDLAVGTISNTLVYSATGSALGLDWSIEGETVSVAWEDWNNDGILDLTVIGLVNTRVFASSVWGNIPVWTTPYTGNCLVWGDWNGDALPDLMIALRSSLFLAWTSMESDDTSSVAWGDWDNDGDPDLAVGNDWQPNRVYRNDGGVLTLAWSSAESDHTQSVAWEDWDGDGDPDLAVGNSFQPNHVYRNDGGVLTLAWSSAESDHTQSVAWGDWDNDGDPDLAVGNSLQSNRVYRNDGGVLTLAWSSAESDHTQSVAWGDWDGDGDLDLAVGNPLQSNRVYRNDGGTLTLAWSSAESDHTQSVAWGDWDGDGDPDLAVGNYWQPNRVYRNDGGTLTLAWSSAEGDGTSSVAWGDWDNDGDPDLAVGNYWRPNRVYRNDGGALTLAWISAEGEDGTSSVAWEDWDNDGVPDLAVGNYWQPNRVYRNIRSTNCQPAGYQRMLASSMNFSSAWTSAEKDKTSSVVWGDADSDNDLDLAAGNWGQPTRVYRRGLDILDPDWSTMTLAWSAPSSNNTHDLAWADWDSDSDLDLAVGNDGVNYLYENVSTGQINLTQVWSSPENEDTRALAWGDWDGDGDLDLAVGNYNQSNRLYRNAGGTLTSIGSSLVLESDQTQDLAWGDYDNDGDPDLAVGNDAQFNRVYRNDGDDFTLAWSSAEADNTDSIAWADYDGDGDLDMLAGNDGQPNWGYRNDGNDTFIRAWSLPEWDNTHSVEWGDWDSDGDLDIVTGNSDNPNRVYRNTNGDLGPDAAWNSSNVKDTYAVDWGDWDNDGDLDVAVGNNGQVNRVYESHLHTSSPLPNSPARALVRPQDRTLDGTAAAPGVHSAVVLNTPVITIPFQLFDDQADSVHHVDAYYSLHGGGQWLPATVVDIKDEDMESRLTNLETSTDPEYGQLYYLLWDVLADDVRRSDNVVFRIVPHSDYRRVGPITRPPYGANSYSFRVYLADLSPSTCRVVPSIASPGSLLTYTLVLSNADSIPAPDVDVQWLLAEHTVFITSTASQGTPIVRYVNDDPWDDILGIRWQGDIVANGQVTITILAQLDIPLPDGTQVVATAQRNGQPLCEDSMSITVYSKPTLDTSTLDAPARVRPGDIIPYTLRMRNTGTMNAPTASASGTLPISTTCTGDFWASAGGGHCVSEAVTWNGPLNVGEEVVVTYDAQTDGGLAASTVLSHTITVQDNITSTITRTVTTTVAVPDLTQETRFTLDKPIALLGETVAFTLTLHNSDIDAPQVQIIIPLSDYIAYLPNSVFGGAVYNAGLHQIEWFGSLAEDETSALNFGAVISTTSPPGKRITTTATIDDGYNPPLTLNQVIRAGVPDMRPTFKDVDRSFVYVGHATTYTLALINANSVDASATLIDPLPVDVSFVSASPGLAYNAGEHRLEWSGAITGNSSITMTCVVSVSSALSDGIPIVNVMYLDDGADYVYTRSASLVTVRPQELDCVDQVCIYADTSTDLGGGQWRFAGRVRIGSLSRADVFLDENAGGYVILDETNGTITGEGRLSLLSNRLYPVLDGSFDITPDTGLVTPGPGASYLFDNLSGFTVSTDTVDVTVNVLQGTLDGTAQIESHVDGLLDIDTQVDFFVDNGGNVDAVVGTTDFNVWGLPMSIEGGYLDNYRLVLNPELTLPMEVTVDIPICHVYPDGIFDGYVEFEQPVAVNLGGWGVAYYNMVFDSDYGLLFPTSVITLPGGTTALMTDLYVNADGTIDYANIQSDFQFEIAGFSLAAHNATLGDAGLAIVSATLTFPFPLTPDSDPLALTFTDLLIAADGNVQSGGLNMSEFDFDFLGWQLHASGLVLDENGVRIPQADLTFPTHPIDLGGRTYHFANVGVTPDGNLYGALTNPQHFDIGDWRADAAQGFALNEAGVCAPEISLVLPDYLGHTTVYFDDVCLDPATGIRAGSLSADFHFGVRGWSLEASRATLVGDELHVLTTTLTIPALDSTQVYIHNLQLGYHSPYILGGSFATDVEADLFDLYVRIPHDKISLGDGGAQIQELIIRLPPELRNQEITLSNLNASPDEIILSSNLTFEVAGLKVEARNSTLSSGGFHAGRAKLALPSSLGNYRTNIKNVRIDANGLTIDGGDVDIRLPSFNVGGGSGLGIHDARVRLKFDSGGYLFDGKADIAVPGMMSVDCRVVFGTPTPPTWPYELREASVHIHGDGFRLPVDATGIFITGIDGSVRLGNPVHFDLNFDFVSAPDWVVHGDLGGWVDTWGQFGVHGHALALHNFIDTYAEVSITRAQGLMGKFNFHTNPRILEGEAHVNLWSLDGRTHFIASGRIKVQIPRGIFGNWQFCFDWWSFDCKCKRRCWWPGNWKCGWHKHRDCWGVVIPSNDIVLARIGMDLGEFKNGRWGAKGTVDLFGIRFGLYIDTSGRIDVTNLDHYQLLDPPRRLAMLNSNAVNRYVEINDDADGAIFALGWYTGTPTLSLVAPDGAVITATTAISNPSIYYEFDTDNQQILYGIQNPQPGGWHLIVDDPPASEEYQLVVIGASAFSTVTVETPAIAETPADPTVTIQGQVGGAYTDTVLSLYTILTPTAEFVFTDTNGITLTETITVYSGRLLAEDVPLNPDGTWSYTWDTEQQPRPAGVYYVYVGVDDERHPPVHAYAPGSVLVVDDAPPAPPAHLIVTPDEGELALTWAANTEMDLLGYNVYHGMVTGTYTYTMDVGVVTQFTLVGLDNDAVHYVAVSAYDLSGNESVLATASAVVTETAPVVCSTPFDLQVPPMQETTTGETVLVTVTAHVTGTVVLSAGNECDFVQVAGEPVVSGTVSVYLEQQSLYLFAEDSYASTQAHLNASHNVPPGDYTIAFSGTIGNESSSASTVLRVIPGASYTVTLIPDQTGIPGDGVSSTGITVTVTDAYGYPVVDGTPVEFSADVGTLSPTRSQTINGIAQTTLTSTDSGPITATVTALVEDIQGEIGVAFQWADLTIVEAQALPMTVWPDGQAQFRFACGNVGNKIISSVLISAVLPVRMIPVQWNSLGLSFQQTGDTSYLWTSAVIESGAGAWITVTGRIDPSYDWSIGDRLTVELGITSLEDGQDYSLENNTGRVVFVVGEPPSMSKIYLPLILRD